MINFIFDCKNSEDLKQLKNLIFNYEDEILKDKHLEDKNKDTKGTHISIVNYHIFENFTDVEKANDLCQGFKDVFQSAYDVKVFTSSLTFVLDFCVKQGRKNNLSLGIYSQQYKDFDLYKKEIEERIMKQKEINEPKLVILPFLTSSVCNNNAQLYFQFKKREVNGFYYIPLNLLLKIIKTDGLILNIDRLIKNPKTFWSGNEFFEYKFNDRVVLSNNQVPSVLDYTKENCEKINKLNAIFLKENQNLEEHGQIHYFNEDYVRLVEERIVLN